MNTDNIKAALLLLQQAVDEMPDVTVTLKLTDREADVLNVICMSDISVPKTVVKIRPSYFVGDTREAEKEVCDLLNTIKRELR